MTPTVVADKIINGVFDWGSPSVGFFVNPRVDGITSCSGTLIGCETFVTAAHCVCSDFSGGIDVLPGSECRTRADLLDPAGKRVFFQHAGFFDVAEVTVDPGFRPGHGHDFAILRLARSVTGVRPSRINQAARPAIGSPAVIVGFGRTGADRDDRGLKRSGHLVLAQCRRAEADRHLCFDYRPPLGPPGTESSVSGGDSGGPLFADLGGGPRLAAVTSGGHPISPELLNNFSGDVFANRAWIAEVAGADLGASACGTEPAPFAGEAGSSILFGSGMLSEQVPGTRFDLEVPPGTASLRLGLNGEFPFTNEVDLYLRAGTAATPDAFDCASKRAGALEFCEVANPEPGTWHVLARRVAGEGRFQVTATLLSQGAAPGGGAPDPPPGPWLSSSTLPGFEAKVRFNGATPGAAEPACIPESLCVSGALAGRPEVFLKVIGPRPNGMLWAQISRFTPSRVEIWMRQVSTGQVEFYELGPVGPASDDVSGLQDRQAFSPALLGRR